MRRLVPTGIALAFSLALSLASPALAQAPCPSSPLPDGPIEAGLFEADAGVAPGVCPRTSLSLAVDGSAILDTPHFFGTFAGGAVLRGTFAWNDRTELFATFDAASARYIVNATLSETAWNVGQLSFGAMRRLFVRGRFALAPAVRLVVPTSTEYEHVRPVGADALVSARFDWRPGLAFHGDAGLTGSMGFGEGPALPAGGATLLAGADWMPRHWFGATFELGSLWGYHAPLYQLTAALALRFAFAKHYGIELAGLLPVAGATRTSFGGGLRFVDTR